MPYSPAEKNPAFRLNDTRLGSKLLVTAAEHVGSDESCRQQAQRGSVLPIGTTLSLNRHILLPSKPDEPDAETAAIREERDLDFKPLLPMQLAPLLRSASRTSLVSLNIHVDPPRDLSLNSLSYRLPVYHTTFDLPCLRTLRIVYDKPTIGSGPGPMAALYWSLYFSRISMPSCAELSLAEMERTTDYHHLVAFALRSFFQYGCPNVRSIVIHNPVSAASVVSSIPKTLTQLVIVSSRQCPNLKEMISSFVRGVEACRTNQITVQRAPLFPTSPPLPVCYGGVDEAPLEIRTLENQTSTSSCLLSSVGGSTLTATRDVTDGERTSESDPLNDSGVQTSTQPHSHSIARGGRRRTAHFGTPECRYFIPEGNGSPPHARHDSTDDFAPPHSWCVCSSAAPNSPFHITQSQFNTPAVHPSRTISERERAERPPSTASTHYINHTNAVAAGTTETVSAVESEATTPLCDSAPQLLTGRDNYSAAHCDLVNEGPATAVSISSTPPQPEFPNRDEFSNLLGSNIEGGNERFAVLRGDGSDNTSPQTPSSVMTTATVATAPTASTMHMYARNREDREPIPDRIAASCIELPMPTTALSPHDLLTLTDAFCADPTSVGSCAPLEPIVSDAEICATECGRGVNRRSGDGCECLSEHPLEAVSAYRSDCAEKPPSAQRSGRIQSEESLPPLTVIWWSSKRVATIEEVKSTSEFIKSVAAAQRGPENIENRDEGLLLVQAHSSEATELHGGLESDRVTSQRPLLLRAGYEDITATPTFRLGVLAAAGSRQPMEGDWIPQLVDTLQKAFDSEVWPSLSPSSRKEINGHRDVRQETATQKKEAEGIEIRKCQRPNVQGWHHFHRIASGRNDLLWDTTELSVDRKYMGGPELTSSTFFFKESSECKLGGAKRWPSLSLKFNQTAPQPVWAVLSDTHDGNDASSATSDLSVASEDADSESEEVIDPVYDRPISTRLTINAANVYRWLSSNLAKEWTCELPHLVRNVTVLLPVEEME